MISARCCGTEFHKMHGCGRTVNVSEVLHQHRWPSPHPCSLSFHCHKKHWIWGIIPPLILILVAELAMGFAMWCPFQSLSGSCSSMIHKYLEYCCRADPSNVHLSEFQAGQNTKISFHLLWICEHLIDCVLWVWSSWSASSALIRIFHTASHLLLWASF